MRKILLVLICCVMALLAGYAGYHSYKIWKQKRLISMAHGFFEKGNTKGAMLSLREALTVNPFNLDANRLAADICLAGRSPETLIWRSRVVELSPHSVEDRLALAQSAMLFGELRVASNAIEGVNADGRRSVAFQNIAGAVAAAGNQLPEASAHFREAIRLDPANIAPRLNLAVIELHATNESAVAEARAVLQVFSVNPTNSNLRCQALRELVMDDLRHKRQSSALALSQELLLQTNSIFRDRLLRLEALQASSGSDFKTMLVACQREASTNLANIYELASWQQNHGTISEGLAWLQSLPAEVRTNQPVALLSAEFYTTLQDWRGLRASLEHQEWQTSDFVRHAFLARALRGLQLVDSSDAEWNKAVIATKGQKMSSIMLLRMAAQWNWHSECEAILRSIVSQYPNEKWAVKDLTGMYFFAGQTQSLLTLFSQQLKARPEDVTTKNNLAMTALLLGATELKPYDLAREAYEKAPTNSSFASTYAFSLLLQKKNAQALSVMDQLNPKDLEDPSIAGYYGMILQANGDRAKAKRYLALTAKATLLPEERKFFEKANTGG